MGIDRASRLNPAGALRAALTSYGWVAIGAPQAPPVSLDSPTFCRPRPMVPTSGRGICYRQLRIGRSLLLVPDVRALLANPAEASAPTPGTPPSLERPPQHQQRFVDPGAASA